MFWKRFNVLIKIVISYRILAGEFSDLQCLNWTPWFHSGLDHSLLYWVRFANFLNSVKMCCFKATRNWVFHKTFSWSKIIDCIRCSSGASASLHWFEIIIKPRKTPKQSTFFGFPCLVFFYSHINLCGSSKISSRVFFFLKSIVFLHLLQKVMASQPGLS